MARRNSLNDRMPTPETMNVSGVGVWMQLLRDRAAEGRRQTFVCEFDRSLYRFNIRHKKKPTFV